MESILAALKNDKNKMNKYMTEYFEKNAIPGNRNSLQNIVDNMIAASSASNLDCMKDCIINLHAVGDKFDLNHDERTCVYAAAERANNLHTGNDIAQLYDMLDVADFAKNSEILPLLNEMPTH